MLIRRTLWAVAISAVGRNCRDIPAPRCDNDENSMSHITQILSAIDAGDNRAAEQLLPLVYEELRKLAALKLIQEKSGQTLQATALVHEAYVRLVKGGEPESGDRGRESVKWD